MSSSPCAILTRQTDHDQVNKDENDRRAVITTYEPIRTMPCSALLGLLNRAKITFHRHLIHTFDLAGYDGKNRWAPYKLVRKLYKHFGPIHVKRIQDAISLLARPKPESFMSITSTDAESDVASSQETGPPSQGGLVLKKRKLTKKEASEEKLMACSNSSGRNLNSRERSS